MGTLIRTSLAVLHHIRKPFLKTNLLNQYTHKVIVNVDDESDDGWRDRQTDRQTNRQRDRDDKIK